MQEMLHYQESMAKSLEEQTKLMQIRVLIQNYKFFMNCGQAALAQDCMRKITDLTNNIPDDSAEVEPPLLLVIMKCQLTNQLIQLQQQNQMQKNQLQQTFNVGMFVHLLYEVSMVQLWSSKI
jgi:hypothetical protein